MSMPLRNFVCLWRANVKVLKTRFKSLLERQKLDTFEVALIHKTDDLTGI